MSSQLLSLVVVSLAFHSWRQGLGLATPHNTELCIYRLQRRKGRCLHLQQVNTKQCNLIIGLTFHGRLLGKAL